MPALPGGEQAGLDAVRPSGLRGGVGRVQPFVPLLLHVALGEAEQPLPAVPAGVVHPTHGQVSHAGSQPDHDAEQVTSKLRTRISIEEVDSQCVLYYIF